MNEVYLEVARLMTRVVPLVLVDDTFALKGGTAINLFARDMPRLSVDLDLVFPDHTLPRKDALRRINSAIREAAKRLKEQGFQTRAAAAADAGETKLFVRSGRLEVKVEVNVVMRGTVHPARWHRCRRTRARRCKPISKFPSYRWKTCMAASWLRQWTGNIRATCLT